MCLVCNTSWRSWVIGDVREHDRVCNPVIRKVKLLALLKDKRDEEVSFKSPSIASNIQLNDEEDVLEGASYPSRIIKKRNECSGGMVDTKQLKVNKNTL